MQISDELTLISETQPRGAFETPTETNRTVFCEVRSVGMRESYTAKSIGLDPDFVFTLADLAEYAGEKRCIYHDVTYDIVRTYTTGGRIELTAQAVRT